jgi:ADP-heptose:LPS heptosyltransferase
MTLATRAPRRVGLSTAREGAHWFYTDVVPSAGLHDGHAVDRYWVVAEALGVGEGPKEFRVPRSEVESAWAVEELRACPRPWLMFAVGARWMTKRWPPDHFAELARRAQELYGGTVVLVGGPDEMAAAQEVMAQLAGATHDLTGRTSLPQLTAVLAEADVLVANDTGPLHLANALGRPVVAPFTCTQVRCTGPYEAEGGAVESQVWCQGSYLRRCDRLECMTELAPDRLWPILQEVLQRWSQTRQSA